MATGSWSEPSEQTHDVSQRILTENLEHAIETKENIGNSGGVVSARLVCLECGTEIDLSHSLKTHRDFATDFLCFSIFDFVGRSSIAKRILSNNYPPSTDRPCTEAKKHFPSLPIYVKCVWRLDITPHRHDSESEAICPVHAANLSEFEIKFLQIVGAE